MNKVRYLKLGNGKYDCCGNLFFEVAGQVTGFDEAAQIEFLETLRDSLLNLTIAENQAFNTIIEMLYTRQIKKPAAS